MFILMLFQFISVLMDFRCYKVKNELIIIGFLIGVIRVFINLERNALFPSVISLLFPFLLLLISFLIGAIGAADIKLFIMTGIYTGTLGVIKIITISFFIGAIFGIAKKIKCRSKITKIRFTLPIFISTSLFWGGVI